MNLETSVKSCDLAAIEPSARRIEDQEAILTNFDRILEKAEADERLLTYNTACRSERARKLSGSYYTPVDVANFFWDQCFSVRGITNSKAASAFVLGNSFVEPSAGSGILVFSLLRKLVSLSVPYANIAKIRLRIIDINTDALNYIRHTLRDIESFIGVEFSHVNFECVDFRKFRESHDELPLFFFGNPPFVANPKASEWKNLYADFLSIGLANIGAAGNIHFILPLSVAFSRDYRAIRERLREERYDVWASHFDNIPDTLFKSGKPQSSNTNKANSQRCTILSISRPGNGKLRSTALHRWTTGDRSRFLTSAPTYYDVSRYSLDNQILRPSSLDIARYLVDVVPSYKLGDLVSNQGQHKLYVASVARNYIGIRIDGGTGVHSLAFGSKSDFYRFFQIVGSDLFYEYWRSVGDGFHITKSNIFNFPVSETVDQVAVKFVKKAREAWRSRENNAKTKLNSGIVSRSYDFTGALPSIIQQLRQHDGEYGSKGLQT